MFPIFFFDPTMVLLIPGIILAGWAQLKVKSTFSKYSKYDARIGLSAAQIAQDILRKGGLSGSVSRNPANKKALNVQIGHVSGNMTDHYDPRLWFTVAGRDRCGSTRSRPRVPARSGLCTPSDSGEPGSGCELRIDTRVSARYRRYVPEHPVPGGNRRAPVLFRRSVRTGDASRRVQREQPRNRDSERRRLPDARRDSRGEEGAERGSLDICGFGIGRGSVTAPAADHFRSVGRSRRLNRATRFGGCGGVSPGDGAWRK